MSNIQSQMNGLSVQVIVQRVVFEYHSPDVTNKGLGQLAGAVRREAPSNSNGGQEPSPTVSAFLVQIPYTQGSYDEASLVEINQNAKLLADQLIAVDGTTEAVNQWYEALKALQRSALQGRRRAVIPPEILSQIEEQMKPYNLGSVWRVRLQARWWYPEQGHGMHACKSGGFAKTVTLRTVYMAGSCVGSAQELADFVVQNWGKVLNNVAREAARSTVVFDDRGKYVRTYVRSGATACTVTNTDGTQVRKFVHRDAIRSDVSKRVAALRQLDLAGLSKKVKSQGSPPSGSETG